MEKLYTVKEVADIYQVTPESVRIWLRAGTMRGVKMVNHKGGSAGGDWRIPESAVNDHVQDKYGDPSDYIEG